jgi:hypothetical protein
MCVKPLKGEYFHPTCFTDCLRVGKMLSVRLKGVSEGAKWQSGTAVSSRHCRVFLLLFIICCIHARRGEIYVQVARVE